MEELYPLLLLEDGALAFGALLALREDELLACGEVRVLEDRDTELGRLLGVERVTELGRLFGVERVIVPERLVGLVVEVLVFGAERVV